jgi:hypothetical protein
MEVLMPRSASLLTPAERSQLETALHHTRHAGTWCRMRALLLLAEGQRVMDVAAALGVHRQAIHKRRTLYEASRTPEALVVRSPPGREPDQRRLARYALSRGAVQAHVRHRIEPHARIPIRLFGAAPAVLTRQHEGVGEVLHGALDLPLRLGAPRLTELQLQGIRAEEVQEARVQLRARDRFAAYQDDGLGLSKSSLRGQPPKYRRPA